MALRVVFAGTPDFARVSLAALLASPHRVCAVYTQPDRPAGRGRRPRPSPVKELALAQGLPLRQPETLRGRAAELAAWHPDVMVVAAYGLLLPVEILAVPPLGCVNVHASLLPRWRGAAPIPRAILAGDRVTGVTLMQMEAGLDTGPILAARETPIGERETAGQLHDRLAALGAELLIETLDRLEAGTVTPEPQDAASATYAPKLTKAEARIDWRRPAVEIDRQVRAFNPRPVAWTPTPEGPLRVWEALPLEAPEGAPGTVLEAGPRLVVACGEGALNLLRLQPPGGRPMEARAYVNGRRPRPGTPLGGG